MSTATVEPKPETVNPVKESKPKLEPTTPNEKYEAALMDTAAIDAAAKALESICRERDKKIGAAKKKKDVHAPAAEKLWMDFYQSKVDAARNTLDELVKDRNSILNALARQVDFTPLGKPMKRVSTANASAFADKFKETKEESVLTQSLEAAKNSLIPIRDLLTAYKFQTKLVQDGDKGYVLYADAYTWTLDALRRIHPEKFES